MPVIARKVLYEGRVQGVGFRYTVKQVATGYEVNGWVRNLENGSVELHAQGEQDEVFSFLDAIEQTHLGSLIATSQNREAEASVSVRGFVIEL